MAAEDSAMAPSSTGAANSPRTAKTRITTIPAVGGVAGVGANNPNEARSRKKTTRGTTTSTLGTKEIPRYRRKRVRYNWTVRSRISPNVDGASRGAPIPAGSRLTVLSGSLMRALRVSGIGRLGRFAMRSWFSGCRGRGRFYLHDRLGWSRWGCGRRDGESRCLHHPFDIVSLLAHALVVVEEGEARGENRSDKGVGQKGHELLQDAEADGQLLVVFEDGNDKEDLGDGEQSDFYDGDQQPKHEDAPAGPLAQPDASLDGRARPEVFHDAGGYRKSVAQPHQNAVDERREHQESQDQRDSSEDEEFRPMGRCSCLRGGARLRNNSLVLEVNDHSDERCVEHDEWSTCEEG